MSAPGPASRDEPPPARRLAGSLNPAAASNRSRHPPTGHSPVPFRSGAATRSASAVASSRPLVSGQVRSHRRRGSPPTGTAVRLAAARKPGTSRPARRRRPLALLPKSGPALHRQGATGSLPSVPAPPLGWEGHETGFKPEIRTRPMVLGSCRYRAGRRRRAADGARRARRRNPPMHRQARGRARRPDGADPVPDPGRLCRRGREGRNHLRHRDLPFRSEEDQCDLHGRQRANGKKENPEDVRRGRCDPEVRGPCRGGDGWHPPDIRHPVDAGRDDPDRPHPGG